MDRTPVYLDWNATAPLSDAARAAWLEAQTSAWGNPTSVHALGQAARHHLDRAKTDLARMLGCRAHELVATSGGSEANALAIRGATAIRGVATEPPDAAIVVSAVEHSSVLRNAAATGRQVRTATVDALGRVTVDSLSAVLDAQVGLVCLQFANNEIGTVQDVPALVALVRQRAPQALVLLDCAQGAGKRRLDLAALGVDLASVAGHKFGAPKGVGLLYVRTGVRLNPLIAGGRQQQDRRSGTEDAAAVCALTAALAESLDHAAVVEARLAGWFTTAWLHISQDLPLARRNGADDRFNAGGDRLASVLSLVHPGVSGEALVARLDLAGFCVSTGAACMAARGEPSHVLLALGLPVEWARSAVRVSAGPGTTEAEIDAFATAYVREVAAMRPSPT